MIKLVAYGLTGVVIVLFIFLAGCVAPPAGQQATPSSGFNPGPVASSTGTTGPVVFVTEATIFARVTPASPTTSYTTLPPVTQNPLEKSCLIKTQTQTYAYNGTAFTYNLKNPPMFIVYSVIPTNITETRDVRIGTENEAVITTDTYSPDSWFEITVRNKTTGEIYLQDGFGTAYTTYLNRTLVVLNTDDLLVETNGNLITATTSFWVKPELNFNSPDQANSTVCAYIDQTRSVIDYPTATPTPTWNGQP
jgi:hypothetical protein